MFAVCSLKELSLELAALGVGGGKEMLKFKGIFTIPF
jgi:hypothetical protein